MQIQQNSPSCAQENLHIELKKDQSPAIFSLAYSKVQYEHGQFWKRIFHNQSINNKFPVLYMSQT